MIETIVIPILIFTLGYIVGNHEKRNIQRPRKVTHRKKTQVSLPQEPEKRGKKRSVKKLGSVSRPSVEDIERRQNPRLVEEEDAWAEDMEKLLK